MSAGAAAATAHAAAAVADDGPAGPETAADAIARVAATTRFEDLDAATVDAARWRVLDVLGCALGGTRAAGSDGLVAVARESGGAAQATVVGQRGLKLPAATAAMVNAVLARAFDYEVMGVLIEGRLIPSHHAATTVPVALALCEAHGLGGRELLTALVVGDDVAARTLAASGLDFGQGWDGAATYAALGAVATAGHLLRLAPRRLRHAMGLTVDQIGGTIQSLWDGATDFKLGQGTAARNAVFSAQLAAQGWTGMADPLQGRHAFFAQYTAGCSEPAILTRALGQRFWAEAYFKPHPACMATHVAIEATQAATAGRVFDADDVQEVVLRLPPGALRNFCAKPFEARDFAHTDAIFSYAHMVACVLLRGGVQQAHYAEATLRSGSLAALTAKVRLAAHADDRTGAEVDVVLRDGRRLAGRAAAPARSPLVQPATPEEILAKFERQVAFSGHLAPAAAAALVRRVRALEHEPRVDGLAALLAGGAAA